MTGPAVAMALAALLAAPVGSAAAEVMLSSPRPMPRPGMPEPVAEAAPAPDRPALYAGQDVFAAADVRCGPQADFLRGYWAEVVEAGPSPTLRLREHLAVMATHGLTDAAGAPDTTSEFWGDYWCIPQRAWCYGPVADTAFGADLAPGQVAPWPVADVAALDRGFLPAFSALRDLRCTASDLSARPLPLLPGPQ